MSVSDLEAFSKIVLEYLKLQVFFPYGSKNAYHGSIPINLDAPFNMGDKAQEQCHPELPFSWMQLLTHLNFTVMWQDGIPIVVMHHNHDVYNFTYTAECPSSIQLKILKCALETTAYKSLRSLLHDVFRIIMISFTQHLTALDTPPECVCLAIFQSSAEQRDRKRKHGDVEL